MKWLLRAFRPEKDSAEYDALVGDLATVRSQLAVANANYARANEALADCQRQGVTLARSTRQLLASTKDAHLRRVDKLEGDIGDLTVQLDRANASVTELEHTVLELNAELTEVSGRLQDALERLALVDRDEDMRDEIRAKRLSDGLGDQ